MIRCQHLRQQYIQMSTHRQLGLLSRHRLQMNMDSNLYPTLKFRFWFQVNNKSVLFLDLMQVSSLYQKQIF